MSDAPFFIKLRLTPPALQKGGPLTAHKNTAQNLAATSVRRKQTFIVSTPEKKLVQPSCLSLHGHVHPGDISSQRYVRREIIGLVIIMINLTSVCTREKLIKYPNIVSCLDDGDYGAVLPLFSAKVF